MSLSQFARHLGVAAAAGIVAEREALEESCKIVEKEAKRVIGTYDYPWPPLAQETVDTRVRLGFTPDDPLLRTGELRNSIEHNVEGHLALRGYRGVVGSNLDKAVYQELGTSKIPPRSFLLGAALHKGLEVAELCGRYVVRGLLTVP